MRLLLVVLSPILRCDDHHDGDKWPLTSLCTPPTTAQVMIMTTMMVIMIIMIMAITHLQFSLQPSPKVQRWWWWWIWQRFSTFCNFFKRITHLHFSLQPSPHRPGAHGKHSPVTWWQVVPLNMNKSWCTLFSKYLERLLMLLWNFSLCFNSNGCSSLRHELILMCDFRCNMSRGWCFCLCTSLQL